MSDTPTNTFPFSTGDKIAFAGAADPNHHLKIVFISASTFLAADPQGVEGLYQQADSWVPWNGSNQEVTYTITTTERIPDDGDRFVGEDGVIYIAYKDWATRPCPVITSVAVRVGNP